MASEGGVATGGGQEDIGAVVTEIESGAGTEGRGLFTAEGLAAGHEAGGESQVNVWGAVVGEDLVGVEVLGGLIPRGEVDGMCPVDEVFGGGASDPADAVAEDAKVADVLLFRVGPEGDVLRIESAISDYGGGLDFGPVDCVGRGECDQAGFAGAADGLVLLGGWRVGVGIEEGGEVMACAVMGEDNVVVGGAVDFEEAELGFGPVDAVGALGVAGDLVVEVVLGLGHAAVIHPQCVAVLKDGEVGAVDAFPGEVRMEDDFPGGGMVEFLSGVMERVDEIVIDEDFALGAEVDGGGGRGYCGGESE
ncbi:MAG: hypothetical protein RI897_3116 [Verrucomicrobiota bacterium]